MADLLNIFQIFRQFDQWWFKKINGEWTNSFFDQLFLLIRQPNFWIPWYLFLFVFVLFNFKKKGWWWIVFFLCTVAMADLIGTRLFKDLIRRDRPCADPEFFSSVRMILKECAGAYSFISNHAANHFGLATFTFLTLRPYFNRWLYLIWIWPVIVSYAQIYVGVHYPTDIIGGTIIGVMLGWFTSYIFNKRFGFANFENQPTGSSEWK